MYSTGLEDKIMCKTQSGNKIYWMITTENGAPNFELRYIEIPPGGKSSYGHHAHEHEVFIVKGEGRIKGQSAGTQYEKELTPGIAVYVPGDEEHQWVNAKQDEPFGFICVVPKGAEAESKPPCR